MSELLVFDQIVASPDHAQSVDRHVDLSFEDRTKARQRVRLRDGSEAAIVIERGHALRGGTLLTAAHGVLLEVVALPEDLCEVRSTLAIDLTRAAYHLGNRHVLLEVGESYLRFAADHVLEEMVRGLGLQADSIRAPFEPEAGAYSHAHQHHAHS